MTTSTRNFTFSQATSVAAIGAWMNGIRNLINDVGLTLVNDTVTQTPSTSANSDHGHVTYRFNDALQLSMPIYIQLKFGNDYNQGPYVTVNVGSSIDGNGVVQPPVFQTFNNTGNAGSYNPSTNSYACYVDGTFAMVLGYGILAGATPQNCFVNLVIDRTRNTSGVAQGSGYLVEASQYSMSTQTQSRSMFGSASPEASLNFMPSMIPSIQATSSSEGANVNVFRHYSMTPGVRPHLGMLTYFSGEFGPLTPITVPVLGSTHTYLPMGTSMNYWSSNPKVSHACAIRWE